MGLSLGSQHKDMKDVQNKMEGFRGTNFGSWAKGVDFKARFEKIAMYCTHEEGRHTKLKCIGLLRTFQCNKNYGQGYCWRTGIHLSCCEYVSSCK